MTTVSIKFLVWLGVYLIFLIIYKTFSHVEHRKDPEKLARYQALPIRFKLACALIALPLFTMSVYGFFEDKDLLKFLWILALIFAMYLEVKAVTWYRENGFF